MYQTKRWNEAIRMTDLKAQSPSLAITMRALFGRTTSRRLRFQARRTSRSVRIFRSDEAEILRRTVAATVIKGAVAIARHYHAGSVRADDIKATAF